MSSRKTFRLEEATACFIDYRGKTPTKTLTGIPLITAKIIKGGRILEPTEFIAVNDYNNWMTRGYPQLGDVVLTTEAPLGEVGLIKDPQVALAQRIILLREKKGVSFGPYIKYYLESNDGQMELISRASGTTVEGIRASELKKVEIPLPPLSEQQAIAEVLSSLDDKIDLLHRNNKTLEEMAETLFRQWFVEGAKEDWEVRRLDDLCTHEKKAINPQKELGSTYYHYSLPSFDNGKRPEQAEASSILSNKYLIQEGDILISKLNPRTPRVWLIGRTKGASICSTEFQVYRVKESYLKGFVYCFLKTQFVTDTLAGASSGTSGSHQRVSPEDISSLEVIVPEYSQIQKFQELVDPILMKIELNSESIINLEHTRDGLLPKLMSGQVKVISN